ncbi:helix-turn-helix domain-containing protein [Campylobacter fetus]|nr:helix-turn-helix domain-containing protein [Campylobacter fetus]EAI5946269.1 helix-turn-helix domain-containing protein [Campylobacter fetus]EAJ0320128.1 helix-turn-helix domain-containing protein [Campylobacter fetus]EAJ0345987.1 helix-turn-helix domain-containing protein [Campylobacter fetus]EAJ1239713.1 helix-turn-helix domain-containing protein [Campylobacter fetus]
MDFDILAQNIRFLLKKHKWSEDELVKRSGVGKSTIQLYKSKKSKNPTVDKLTKIANAFKVSSDDLKNKNLSISMSISQKENISQNVHKFPKMSISKSNLSSNEPLNTPNLKKSQNEIHINIKEDTVYVPFFKDGAVSAGFGTEDFGNDCDFLPFKKQDLRLMFNAHSTANLAVIPCMGNSMQPTIEEGELVVFQQDGTQSEGAIYVVRFENELFVKRLKKRPLQLISDNATYEPISLSESQSFEILGRVIGSYSIHSKRF